MKIQFILPEHDLKLQGETVGGYCGGVLPTPRVNQTCISRNPDQAITTGASRDGCVWS